MQDKSNRLAAWVAIFAIALQGVLAGVAGGLVLASPLDPATVICHSDASGSGPDQQAPATQHDCCAQCVLCSPQPSAIAPSGFAPFTPPQPRQAVFIPFPAAEPAPLDGLAVHSARGPPRKA